VLLGQKFSQVLGTSGSRIAMRYTGKSTTFKDAYTYIQRESFWIQNEIGHQKRVGVMMTNTPHFWYIFFGLANTMNTMVPFDPALPDPVIADRMKLLQVDTLIISDDLVARTRQMLRENSLTPKVLEIEKRRFGEYDTTYRVPVGMSPKETDPIVILPTSGHAGKVRFVPISHKMVEAGALATRSPYRFSGIDSVFTFQQSFANPFVFFHGGLYPLLHGAGLVIWDNPTIAELVPELVEAKMSRLLIKATQVYEFLNSCVSQNLKLPTLRSITIGRGNVDDNTRKFADGNFNGTKILRVYGQTETCWAVAMTQMEEPEPGAYCGSVLPGVKARIVDYQGDEIPTKSPQIGQLVISSAITLPQYVEDKDASKLYVRGASFFTGDWCELTKDNKLRYIDRRDNIIRVGPNIITPEEIEQVLATIPEVERVTALELKDGMGKARCVAVIQRRPKTNINTTELVKFLESKLPKGHAPDRVAFVDEMPTDDSGINKYKLRRDLAGLV